MTLEVVSGIASARAGLGHKDVKAALKRRLEQRQEQETPERALATSLAAQKADITLLEAHARYR